MECTDSRDRIFGLLGLATDAEELGIQVNYAKSYKEVLLDVTVRILREKSLFPLNCWDIENLHDSLKLPSWVSRWTDGAFRALDEYNPSGKWKGTVNFSDDYRTLHLHGIKIASVQVTRPIPVEAAGLRLKATISSLECFESVVQEAREHLLQDQNSDSVIAITLMGNSGLHMSPEGSIQTFNAFRKLVANGKSFLQQHPEEQTVSLATFIKQLSAQEQRAVEAFDRNNFVYRRSLCLVDGHRISLAPAHTKKGDVIVVFIGGPSFYVLRPDGDKYLHVGDAKIYGVMDGEILNEPLAAWHNKVERFSII
jgi:hypothetical protein